MPFPWVPKNSHVCRLVMKQVRSMGVSASGLKTGYPLWAKHTQLYYADKGVVIDADLVILATQSTKRLVFFFFLLVFFHSHPPTHGIVEVKEARMRNIHRVTAAVDNDKSRQSRCNLRGRQRQSFPDHCMLWSGVCVCVWLHLLERDWWDLIQTVKLYEIKLLPVRSWRKKKKRFHASRVAGFITTRLFLSRLHSCWRCSSATWLLIVYIQLYSQ